MTNSSGVIIRLLFERRDQQVIRRFVYTRGVCSLESNRSRIVSRRLIRGGRSSFFLFSVLLLTCNSTRFHDSM